MRLHPLPPEASKLEAPARFTYPFCYEPHPLCLLATKALQSYLDTQQQWSEELAQGKMMGVLVVEQGMKRGFLAAFSGTLAGQTQHAYFVPPVFDLMAPGCHFQEEQDRISGLNLRIKTLQESLHESPLRTKMEEELGAFRQQIQQDKEKRHHLRQTLSAEALQEIEPQLIRESQYQKAELRRLQKAWEARIAADEATTRPLRLELSALQEERRDRSVALQQWLFQQYGLLNAKRQETRMLELFRPNTPPSGAGECCAPKLLQYAYLHNMKPLCMAEFWVGASPRDEIRHHGHFYPACNSKCRPILRHMLQGLEVDPNPLLLHYEQTMARLRIIYQDNALAVVYKPAGMLSIPGKDDLPSVQDVIKERFPHTTGPIIVHRLDMDTSGLMVVALDEEVYHRLQQRFLRHQVEKAYIALLEHEMPMGTEGEIRLPLAPDYADRPRQRVATKHGKEAVTRYRVLENKEGHARVELRPLTGRTHQLRVHCAHPDGLGNPIVGDRLYGKPAQRLMLHAQTLCFNHPLTGQPMEFNEKEI